MYIFQVGHILSARNTSPSSHVVAVYMHFVIICGAELRDKHKSLQGTPHLHEILPSFNFAKFYARERKVLQGLRRVVFFLLQWIFLYVYSKLNEKCKFDFFKIHESSSKNF